MSNRTVSDNAKPTTAHTPRPAESIFASIPQCAYSADQVKRNESVIAEQYNIAMMQLMRDAGYAAFELFKQQWPSAKTVFIACGKGNNAGDGYIFASQALKAGFKVLLLAVDDANNYQGDAHTACQEFMALGGKFSLSDHIDFNSVDVIIDALLGIGIRGDVRPELATVINLINQQSLPVLSIDLPSGLNADTGRVNGCCVKADLTITFIALKQGMLTGKAKAYCGDIYLAGLGLEQRFAEYVDSTTFLLDRAKLAPLQTRSVISHKVHSGNVLVLAGNKNFPGAARLASEAALRSGAGLVTLACHQNNRVMIGATRAELMFTDLTHLTINELAKVNVILLGPGLGQDEWAKMTFAFALAQKIPLVVDADGLNLLAKAPQKRDHWVLTPHPGEAARLLDCSIEEIEQDRFKAVKKIAQQYGGICVLKGAGTLISDGQVVFINLAGNAGMATGGMGDVLSGMISALRLQSDTLFSAVCHSVHIHSQAADDLALKHGQKGLLASDLFPRIRQLVNI